VLPAPMAAFDEVEDMEITCEEANGYEAGSLAYTNGGTGDCEISGSVAGELSGTYTECGGTLTVNWTYKDDCERTIKASKTITVLPAPMAAFDEVEDMEITCEEANGYEAGSLAYTNGGTGDCEISGSVAGELSGTYTECGGALTVNWTYKDNCERTIEASKTITVLPAPMADFDEIEGGELTCEEAYAFVADSLAYTNGASGACEISGSIVGFITNDFTSCGGFLYVDYTYTDDCGRTINKKPAYIVLPAPIAEFDEVEDMEISCKDLELFEVDSLAYTNGGSDSCEISGSVSGEAQSFEGSCGSSFFIDYIFTDECGRTITAKQTITVVDDIVPFSTVVSQANIMTIDFTAYPVPFDNEVNIAYSFEFDTNVTIQLFDTKGIQVFSETNKNYVAGSNGKSRFDLSRYSSQMLLVKLTTNHGTVTKKIVASGKK
jgi:hypothetical protein